MVREKLPLAPAACNPFNELATRTRAAENLHRVAHFSFFPGFWSAANGSTGDVSGARHFDTHGDSA